MYVARLLGNEFVYAMTTKYVLLSQSRLNLWVICGLNHDEIKHNPTNVYVRDLRSYRNVVKIGLVSRYNV